MSDGSGAPTYAAEAFDLAGRGAPEECDLVLKGGLTSGVVYPYALLEVAQRYRLRSIGGASAGAIAASFAAAAEFARRVGDPHGFVRLGERCEELPAVLQSLFQPEGRFAPILAAGLAFTAPRNKVGGVLWQLRQPLTEGGLAGLLIYMLLAYGLSFGQPVAIGPVLLGTLLATVLGAGARLALWLRKTVLQDLAAANFGLCPGIKQPGHAGGGFTDWLHEGIQLIAFADPKRQPPLTFGALEGGQDAAYSIDLRAMTTNLSLQRPEVAPRLRSGGAYFDIRQWQTLFPADVMAYLTGKDSNGGWICPPHATEPNLRRLPKPDDLPVIVAVRMSLSFPLLIQAVPLHMEDIGARARGELAPGAAVPIQPIWFSDGGITSNFPVHFFDTLLPTRPTFAFSLDPLPDTQTNPKRVLMPQDADDGALLPIHQVRGLGGFAGSILASAKDWQDQSQSVLPGQRQRVVRVRLSKTEGGLNLNMSGEVIDSLMALGRQAGQAARQDFDFDEHRWRRSLVAYEQLEVLHRNFRSVWPTYSLWFAAYDPQSYVAAFGEKKRATIRERLDAFAAVDVLDPPLDADFPRPRGRLRTTPEL